MVLASYYVFVQYPTLCNICDLAFMLYRKVPFRLNCEECVSCEQFIMLVDVKAHFSKLKIITNTMVLTLARVAKLCTHNSCSIIIPRVVTDCSPELILADLHSSLMWS